MTGDCAYRKGGARCFWRARNLYRGRLYCDTHYLQQQIDEVQENAAEYLRRHGERVDDQPSHCEGCNHAEGT